MITKLPHEIKSEETKQKILAATEKLLGQYDFKYRTVRNICEEAGTAYGSFYHHFSSKENLLYVYTNQLYVKNIHDNPVPAWIDKSDYIKHVLWYVVVLGCFCEAAGKDLIGYVYKNCPQGIFEATLKKEILSILSDADERGFIDHHRNKDGRVAVELVVKDMEIICAGTLMWWSGTDEDAEPLHETLEHLCFNLLYSFCSDQYRQMDYHHILLTENPAFAGSVAIHGVPSGQAD